MSIQIRPIRTIAEFRAIARIEESAWGTTEPVPDHVLLTAQKNGGLVLGAFETVPEKKSQILVGFLFGFIGLTPDGRLKHCSHMVGVDPGYQDQQIGYKLKLAQRDHVLAQGINLVTWTFDPLESRNANLNFRKLGAVCCTYLPNLYSDMSDHLNLGVPSDRFQVDWHVTSNHVRRRLGDNPPLDALDRLLANGVPIVNRMETESQPVPPAGILPIQGERLLIQIPARFQDIKERDLEAARAWRLLSRALFQEAFAEDYSVVDLLYQAGRSYYLLERGWKP